MSVVAPSLPRVRRLALGSDFLARLESLRVRAGRLTAGGRVSTRSGSVRGGRVEFLDHRGYVEGDDLRDLDWNVYARTNELFIKVFGAQRRKHVHLLLDLSPSMSAAPGKELCACRLTAAVAHVALAAGDSVRLLAADRDMESPVYNGPAASREVIDFLERLPAGAPFAWDAAAARFRARPRPAGALVVVSDFWAPAVVTAFTDLRRRQDLFLLHLLSPGELAPSLDGNVRLEDPETGEEVSLRLTPRDLAAYAREVERHVSGLAARARRHGMRHLLCRSDTPFEQMVLGFLQRGGLLGGG